MKLLCSLLLLPFTLLGIAQSAVAEPSVSAYLYNPGASQIVLEYPYKKPPQTMPLKPTLAVHGESLADGDYRLTWSIEKDGKALVSDETPVKVSHGHFDIELGLKDKYPSAERVSWRLVGTANQSHQGVSPLAWSRFHGRVRYHSGKWHSSWIELLPIRFGAPGNIKVPVADDGTFDALVPARIYTAVFANGSGYVYDVLERWAWTYDLRHDREDQFIIGEVEIYGIRAFEIIGGPKTLHVFFRPSSTARVLSFDSDGDGVLSESDGKALDEAMKHSPTAIGPELKAENIRILLDGQPLPIAQVTKIPEVGDNGTWQVDYLVQCQLPPAVRKANNDSWHREVKIEITSPEVLRGQKITEFGEATTDIFWP